MRKRLFPFAAALLATLVGLVPASAQSQSRISLIRDAEIEHIIRSYATPLFQAAGLNPNSITLYLVKDKQINAFVAGGMNLFLNTGLIMRSENPSELIGVIAHEIGHISGGHLARRGESQERALGEVIASYVLGLGAALATGQPGIGAAVISGGQDIALKGILQYSRTQETSADKIAGDLLYGTKQSPRGLLTFMQGLEGQEVFLSDNQDPYLRTHPLTQDRVDFFRRVVEASPYKDAPPRPEFLAMHKRMLAKLNGFIEPSAKVMRLYPESDTSVPARYARAIAHYRVANLKEALPLIDALIAEMPEDPYFHELRGQMLLENGRVAEAVPELRTAIAQAPEALPIRQMLVHALLELGKPETDREALQHLELILRAEPHNAAAWRMTAVAEGRSGDRSLAAVALAEAALARGDNAEARDRARVAQKQLKAGSGPWLRSQDILNEASRRLARD